MQAKVSFIVLNWNGWKDTLECLESLYQINYSNYDVIVVDNGSEDNSIKKIKEYFEGKITVKSKFFKYDVKNKPIKVFEYFENDLDRFRNDKTEFESLSPNKKAILIKNSDNKGYAEGNNVGIRFVFNNLDTEYTMILNNDIVVDPDILNHLMIVAQKTDDIGILGPANLSYANPDEILSLGAKMNFWTGGWHAINQNINIDQNLNSIEVDFVGGAAFMIKREVIIKIGFFYSPYFANWEETDYCIKAKNNDFKVICAPESKIWHKTSSSISVINPTRTYWILKNNIIFMRRNAKLRYLPSFFLFYFFLRVPSFIYWGSRGNSIYNLIKLVQMVTKAIKEGITLKIN